MLICEQCSFQNPSSSRYCSQCGAQLAAPSTGQLPIRQEHEADESSLRAMMPARLVEKIHSATAIVRGERREVTVLHLRLDGLLPGAHPDEEETVYLHKDRILDGVAQVVYKYEGYIEKFTGDSLVTLFGAPVAHENDPERAVRTALEIAERFQQWRHAQSQSMPQVGFRIGIHTGPIIVGKVGPETSLEVTTVGNTLTLAASLSELAESGIALISATAYQRTRPVFHFQAWPQTLQTTGGKSIRAYKPLEVRRRPGQTRGLPGMQVPMVGRNLILAKLEELIESVAESQAPHVALVTGEAGVGKSRLVTEFRRWLRRKKVQTVTVLESNSLAYARSRPYWTAMTLLRNMAGLVEHDPPDVQMKALMNYLQELGAWEPEIWPYLAYWLDLPIDDEATKTQLKSLDTSALQRLTHGALRRVLIAETILAPTLIILEDLHWIDAASWEFFQLFLQQSSLGSLMVLLVSRDQSGVQHADLTAVTAAAEIPFTYLPLTSLSEQESHQLVDTLVPGSSDRIIQLKQEVVQRAEGNPFYTEEIIRMLLDERSLFLAGESWQISPQAFASLQRIPGTLQDLILARFDHLSPSARETMQVAAVLGSSFPVSLLHATREDRQEQIDSDLEEATERLFLYSYMVGEERHYQFRHSLVMETIYGTLLSRRRRQLHLEAAQTIQQFLPRNATKKVEMLAYHYARSSDKANAIFYLIAAAESAARRYANETAVEQYRQALDLIEEQPGTEKSHYLRAKIGLGQTSKLLGHLNEAKEILSASLQEFLRWSMVAESDDMLPLLVSGLRELGDAHLREGKYETAISHLEAGLEALGDTGQDHHSGLWLTLMERLSFVHLRQGKLDSAFALAHTAITEFNPRRGQDPITVASLYNTLGGIAWQQGNLDEAIFYVGQSLDPYESLGYTWGTANAYSNLGILLAQRGKWQETLKYWEKALALRQEIGDVHNQAISHANLGQLRLNMGDDDKADDHLQDALRIFHRIGDNYGIAETKATLAEAALARDDVAAATAYADAALNLAQEINNKNTEAHAFQLQARILSSQGKLEESLVAIEAAQQQVESLGLSEVQANCLRVRGQIYKRLRRWQEAETSLLESIEICRQINDPYRLALANLAMGHLYQVIRSAQQPEYEDKARNFLEQAESQFEKLGAQRDLVRVRRALHSLQTEVPPASQAQAALATPLRSTGDRRLAAIMLVKLQLPETEDEEAIFEATAYAITAVSTIVQEYQGLANQRPDGIEAVFGLPAAHEDDAERAVQTANQIHRYLTGEVFEIPLAVRISVTFGEVIGRQVSSAQYAQFIIQGEPRQQAEQLLAAAEPGQVLVTEKIWQETKRLFTYEPVYVPALQRSLWRLDQERPAPVPKRGLPKGSTRFVGRDTTLRQIRQLTENLSHGIGGLVLIEGEPGIGKSRLMREFRASLSQSQTIWTGSCSALESNQPFHLFTNLLTQLFQIQAVDSAEQIRTKMEQVIQKWPRHAQTTRPYLEVLLGLHPSGPEGDLLQRLEPDQWRQQTFVAWRRLLQSLSKRQPVILLLDDLHWIDPISAEMLLFLMNLVASAPVLFVTAQRRQGADIPNERLVRLQSLLPGQTIKLMLRRLSQDESQALINDVFAEMPLPKEVNRQIIAQSDGNPYFIEEFARMFIEQEMVQHVDGRWQLSPAVNLSTLSLPSSLEALIQSRVDALPENLAEVLRCASVIGREFEPELLAEITAVFNVRSALDRLSHRLMVTQNLETDQWQFSHALFASVVYNSMLKSRRTQLHQRVARARLSKWETEKSEQAAELSYHLLRADMADQAIPFLIMAGEQALAKYANEVAITHFQTAHTHLQKLPHPAPEWTWRIAVGLGDAYHFSGRYDAARTILQETVATMPPDALTPSQFAALQWRMARTAHAQGDNHTAQELYVTAQGRLGKLDSKTKQVESAKISTGLALTCLSQGDFAQARMAGKRSLELARAADDIIELAKAENALGGTYFWQGDWRSALHHTTKAMVLREQMGYSWGVAATLSNMGLLAVNAGHWHKARAFFARSLALREEIGDVEGVVITHNNLGNLLRDQGDLAEAEWHLRESLKLARSRHIQHIVATSFDGLAEVLLMQGDIAGAEQMIQNGLDTATGMGAHDLLAIMLRIQAEILLAKGEGEAALASAQDAVRLAGEAGNRSYEAAGWRVVADAHLFLQDYEAAQSAIDTARQRLSDTTDELGSALVALQAGRVHMALDQMLDAEAEFRAAHGVFRRLGAKLYLRRLDELFQLA